MTHSTLSCLIVDDEKRAVALLKKLLEETAEFSEIHSAYSATSAIELVRRFHPQLIFLDIRMPENDGFQLLAMLKEIKLVTEVVFVTAYEEFALRALKNHAFDYLMKPVLRDELKQSIEQFKERRYRQDFDTRLEKFLFEYESSHKIRFNTRTGFFQVDPTSIIYCTAEGNYTKINTGEREQICTLNLSFVHDLLPQQGIVRVGRSLLINANFIYKVDRKAGEVTFEKAGKFFNLSVSTRQAKEIDRMV
jgi:two-component system, LytTR family, response regulator